MQSMQYCAKSKALQILICSMTDTVNIQQPQRMISRRSTRSSVINGVTFRVLQSNQILM